MKDWKAQIKVALNGKLSGEKSHLKMIPPERELYVSQKEAHEVKHSGVLLLIYPDDNELYLSCIKRPDTMKFHAGQIGLPGGKIDEGDADCLQAGLRETWEEIGVHPDNIDILGALSALYVSVSQFMIHPFVGWCSLKPAFEINTSEVEHLLLFPILQHLPFPKTICMNLETVTGPLNVPAIAFQGEIIWGATAMIIAEFYDVLNSSLNQE